MVKHEENHVDVAGNEGNFHNLQEVTVDNKQQVIALGDETRV